MSEPDYLDHIYCEKCIEGMRRHLPDDAVEVIVTSPPYNIGVNYGEYDDNRPFEEYLDWMKELGEQCARILKPQGSFFLNIGDRPSDELRSFEIASAFREYFHVQNTIHWVKSIAVPEEDINIGHYKPVNSGRYLNNMHEYIFHFTLQGNVPVDKLAIGVPYQDKSNIGRWKKARQDCRDRGNMWFIPYDTVQSRKDHPAAFPPRLPEMCLRLHGDPKHESAENTDVPKNDDPTPLVLDPFMGSGSTALAAKRCEYHYVGFEVDAEYVRIARRRLSQTQLPLGQ
ncbi:MAG: DNA-methyltransferase [Planctomycetota bacterium]